MKHTACTVEEAHFKARSVGTFSRSFTSKSFPSFLGRCSNSKPDTTVFLFISNKGPQFITLNNNGAFFGFSSAACLISASFLLIDI
jgi:hypothetical protein